jgi:hypothetical protein
MLSLYSRLDGESGTIRISGATPAAGIGCYKIILSRDWFVELLIIFWLFDLLRAD